MHNRMSYSNKELYRADFWFFIIIYRSTSFLKENYMQIVTDDLILRNWEEKDAERLASIANNKKIADNLQDNFPHPYSLDDAKEFISSTMQKGKDSEPFAIEINGIIVGSICATFKDNVRSKNVEIGYFLAEEYWGRGIIPDAIKCITGYLFENYDIIRVYAKTYSTNKNSRRVLEKAGFRLEAILKKGVFKNGIFQDDCIYAILRDEVEKKM